MSDAARFAVIGGGAWGTALARLLAQRGGEVAITVRRAERAAEIAAAVERGALPTGITATATAAEALRSAAIWVLAVPVAGADEAIAAAAGSTPDLIVNGAKGFLDDTLRSVADLARERLRVPVVTLSGPNLSDEIHAGLPTAAVVAGDDPNAVARAQTAFAQANFRVYPSDDPRGVEVLGGAKNVIALAAGMSDALGLGTNAKATLLTRGLAELTRIARHAGAQERTCFGLAGVGDLIATCSGSGSRNHRAGAALAQGTAANAIPGTHEGTRAVAHVAAYARRHDLAAPIAKAVEAVVSGRASAATALATLLARPIRGEWCAEPA
jgi:glycerol-3-phosphate dehydrogenase (NAD(P)+)